MTWTRWSRQPQHPRRWSRSPLPVRSPTLLLDEQLKAGLNRMAIRCFKVLSTNSTPQFESSHSTPTRRTPSPGTTGAPQRWTASEPSPSWPSWRTTSGSGDRWDCSVWTSSSSWSGFLDHLVPMGPGAPPRPGRSGWHDSGPNGGAGSCPTLFVLLIGVAVYVHALLRSIDLRPFVVVGLRHAHLCSNRRFIFSGQGTSPRRRPRPLSCTRRRSPSRSSTYLDGRSSPCSWPDGGNPEGGPDGCDRRRCLRRP